MNVSVYKKSDMDAVLCVLAELLDLVNLLWKLLSEAFLQSLLIKC